MSFVQPVCYQLIDTAACYLAWPRIHDQDHNANSSSNKK